MRYRLTPLERRQLEWIQQNEPVAGADLFMSMLGGASERFESNLAQRREGIQGLREMAMQLAGGTAEEEALTNAITGQAEQLPMMAGTGGERRIEGLEEFVGGLYGEGPVSGLAPYDVRSQFSSSEMDEDDRLTIAQTVSQQAGQGTAFKDINEQIRRDFATAGYDENAIAQAQNEAELAYERFIGSSLEHQRDIGAGLRELIGGDWNASMLSAATRGQVPEETFDPLFGDEGMGVQGFLAAAVNDPALYQGLGNILPVGNSGNPALTPGAATGGYGSAGTPSAPPAPLPQRPKYRF